MRIRNPGFEHWHRRPMPPLQDIENSVPVTFAINSPAVIEFVQFDDHGGQEFGRGIIESVERPDETQAAFMRRGIGWSSEQIRDLLAERDAHAGLVAAFVAAVTRVRDAEDSDESQEIGDAWFALDCLLLPDQLPAAARALLAERDELRAKLEMERRLGSTDRIMLAEHISLWHKRAERAEAVLREIADRMPIGTWREIAYALQEKARAYFAAAAPEEEER
ncbi:MAG: hypothetical protein KGL35_08180 [Bradyrhizobium sp.]|nr:hypothetical protein [Bradyrhizobium sp.]